MTNITAGLAGVLAGIAIADIYLSLVIYLKFPRQKVRPWPLSGFWMAHKTIRLLKYVRVQMMKLHACAAMFPLTSAHNNATREFVQVVKDVTLPGRQTAVKS